ncbi:hypothetical protein, partial [Klebsiella pneumoniae]|uniref:hypothetical protein n=1 Tax=Klebsiella pneumoniae TaxID=573 RepID=UPI00301344C4
FFDAVGVSGVMSVEGGLVREPTTAEQVANQTAKSMKLFRIESRTGSNAVNMSEITGGRSGPRLLLTDHVRSTSA